MVCRCRFSDGPLGLAGMDHLPHFGLLPHCGLLLGLVFVRHLAAAVFSSSCSSHLFVPLDVSHFRLGLVGVLDLICVGGAFRCAAEYISLQRRQQFSSLFLA